MELGLEKKLPVTEVSAGFPSIRRPWNMAGVEGEDIVKNSNPVLPAGEVQPVLNFSY